MHPIEIWNDRRIGKKKEIVSEKQTLIWNSDLMNGVNSVLSFKRQQLKQHIKVVHLEIKPFKYFECPSTFSNNFILEKRPLKIRNM